MRPPIAPPQAVTTGARLVDGGWEAFAMVGAFQVAAAGPFDSEAEAQRQAEKLREMAGAVARLNMPFQPRGRHG